MRRCFVPLLLSSLVLAGCSGGDPSTVDEPPAAAGAQIDGLVPFPGELTRGHVEGAVEYPTRPPVGGDHNARWLACDVYDEAVPDELAVHSLEHGAVWLAYAPRTPQEQVDRLAELAGRNPEYVLVSPVEDMDAAVTAVAWGVSLPVDGADDERLGQFVDRYAGGDQGGEPGVPCRTGGATLREARGLVQTQAQQSS